MHEIKAEEDILLYIQRNLLHTEIFGLLFLKRLCGFMCPATVVHQKYTGMGGFPFIPPGLFEVMKAFWRVRHKLGGL